MKEIRIHARAGQGAITAATLLATAAFAEGKYALAFPNFGSERMGAPMNAFVRLSDSPIRSRNQIRYPDYVLVQDPSLLIGFNVVDGIKETGAVLVNDSRKPEELCLNTLARVYTVPASCISEEIFGRADRANTALLGAFAAVTGEVGLEALKEAIRSRFSGDAWEKNALALQKAYEHMKGTGHEPAVAASCVATVVERKPLTLRPGLVASPGTSPANKTGSWRTQGKPSFIHKTCTACDLCALLCPEGCLFGEGRNTYYADYDYCKGCGICAKICPVKDIEMVPEAG